MRFNLGDRFKVCQDVLPWPDPFKIGITFHIRRRASKEHQKWVRDNQTNDPVLRGIVTKLFREAVSAKQERDPEAFKEQWSRLAVEAAADLVESGQVDPFALLSRTDALDEAVALIDNWQGLTDENGVAVACGPETKRELLTNDMQVPEGEEFAGLSLGEALVLWIFQKSESHDYARTKLLEGAEKNSETSSAGA